MKKINLILLITIVKRWHLIQDFGNQIQLTKLYFQKKNEKEKENPKDRMIQLFSLSVGFQHHRNGPQKSLPAQMNIGGVEEK